MGGERAALLPVLGCVLCVVLGQCGAVWHTWNSKNMVRFTMGTLVIASASMAWKGYKRTVSARVVRGSASKTHAATQGAGYQLRGRRSHCRATVRPALKAAGQLPGAARKAGAQAGRGRPVPAKAGGPTSADSPASRSAHQTIRTRMKHWRTDDLP